MEDIYESSMGVALVLLVTTGARAEVPMGFLITGRVYCEYAITTELASRPTPPPASHNDGVVPVGGKLRAASSEELHSGRGGSELRTAGGSTPGEVALGGGRLRFGWREAADDGGSAPVGGRLCSGRGVSHSGQREALLQVAGGCGW
ncbi:hypothetical protein GUJ93_ZPchr0015g6806 [Zizania palustris]|uniref:Uncharacterized protein n=1 Tax=Zizania palustris TaxID=103762 RepID=A0A8J5TI61_ZIZPA|nr:hypothetical protein GUJ93_ZPchr0015g6806 [Zizania palustris]